MFEIIFSIVIPIFAVVAIFLLLFVLPIVLIKSKDRGKILRKIGVNAPNGQYRFCKFCGSILSEDSKVCPKCNKEQ